MGMRTTELNLVDEALGLAGLAYADCQMLELGNQWVRSADCSSKSYFLEQKGLQRHVSIDLNGSDGALPMDLRLPIPDSEHLGAYNLMTNFGTTEHVDGQWQCYRNIHDLVAVHGLMVHAVPRVGNWKGHCEHFYTVEFFAALAEANRYEILKNEVNVDRGAGKEMVTAILRKTPDSAFEVDASAMPPRIPYRKQFRGWKRIKATIRTITGTLPEDVRPL